MRRRTIPVLAALAATLAGGHARAAAGTALAETSRPAALANATSALPGDAGTMLLNPAGLADLREPVVLVTGQAAYLGQWFARSGEAAADRSRAFGTFGFAAATPLPGPAWLRRFRIGLALDIPVEHALAVGVPVRLDQPMSPLYDGRLDRTSVLGTVAAEILPWLRLGGGVVVTPSLSTPTEVTYVPGRGQTVDDNVVVRLDRELHMGASAFVGLRVQPVPALSMSFAFRDAQISRAEGTQRTVAGGIVADDPIRFEQLWDPAEVVFGAAVFPKKGWSFSADVTLHAWSRAKSGFGTDLPQPFRDTVSLRSGVEWRARPWLVLRSGWAVEPSPVPEQIGETNYLASNTMTLAGGSGLDLRALTGLPMAIDLHLRGKLADTQSAHKDLGALPDADAMAPGQQITNLGYPGFRAASNVFQVGLTLTLFVGKGP